MQKQLSAFFYVSPAGNQPVLEWLRSLTGDEKKAIGGDIQSVEFGWPLGMPTVEKVNSRLRVVRTVFKGQWYRIFFHVDQDSKNMILLHGFKKKSNRIPQNEIKIAEDRLRNM